MLHGFSSNSVISIERELGRHSAVDHIKPRHFYGLATLPRSFAKSEYALVSRRTRQSLRSATGSPEKAAYSVFIAVLFGKKVVLCAVGRNSDMMSDFLHRATIPSEAL